MIQHVGIPAIVSVANATEIFCDGEVVELNGDTGGELSMPVVGLLLLAAHLLMFPFMDPRIYPSALLGLATIFSLYRAEGRVALAGYLLVVYFAMSRMFVLLPGDVSIL